MAVIVDLTLCRDSATSDVVDVRYDRVSPTFRRPAASREIQLR